MTPSNTEGSGPRDTRVDLYLSGGGFRAALGAVGIVFFLHEQGRWADTRRIVSVSGGGLVNASLALKRPGPADIESHLSGLFALLTSRNETLRAATPALLVAMVSLGAGTYAALLLGAGWAWSVLAALFAFSLALSLASRVWLFALFRPIVGNALLGDLKASQDWPVEHVFVASDLSEQGSVFISTNCIQPTIASLRWGIFDARHVPFRSALRATTALPPVLPPLRLKLHRTNPRRSEVQPRAERDWVSSPGPDGAPEAVLLTDGGITGNLGIQLDSVLAPDNLALLEVLGAKTKAGTPTTPGAAYDCLHGEIAWLCRECEATVIVVDASGTSPKRSRWVGLLVNVPVLGVVAYAFRALKLSYESSLVDDQSLAGDQLVGVVRSRQVFERLARKNGPWKGRSFSATQDMVAAGGYLQVLENFSDPKTRAITRGFSPLLPGFSPLLTACVAAREASAEIGTGLHAVQPKKAALVVASAYLNACLNQHGPGAFEVASRGMDELARMLGPTAELEAWWRGVNDSIGPVTTPNETSR